MDVNNLTVPNTPGKRGLGEYSHAKNKSTQSKRNRSERQNLQATDHEGNKENASPNIEPFPAVNGTGAVLSHHICLLKDKNQSLFQGAGHVVDVQPPLEAPCMGPNLTNPAPSQSFYAAVMGNNDPQLRLDGNPVPATLPVDQEAPMAEPPTVEQSFEDSNTPQEIILDVDTLQMIDDAVEESNPIGGEFQFLNMIDLPEDLPGTPSTVATVPGNVNKSVDPNLAKLQPHVRGLLATANFLTLLISLVNQFSFLDLAWLKKLQNEFGDEQRAFTLATLRDKALITINAVSKMDESAENKMEKSAYKAYLNTQKPKFHRKSRVSQVIYLTCALESDSNISAALLSLQEFSTRLPAGMFDADQIYRLHCTYVAMSNAPLYIPIYTNKNLILDLAEFIQFSGQLKLARGGTNPNFIKAIICICNHHYGVVEEFGTESDVLPINLHP